MSLIFSLSFRLLHPVAYLTSQFGSQKCLGFNSSKIGQRSSALWGMEQHLIPTDVVWATASAGLQQCTFDFLGFILNGNQGIFSKCKYDYATTNLQHLSDFSLLFRCRPESSLWPTKPAWPVSQPQLRSCSPCSVPQSHYIFICGFLDPLWPTHIPILFTVLAPCFSFFVTLSLL